MTIPTLSLPKVVQRIAPVVESHGAGRQLSRVQLARAVGYTNPISGRYAALVTSLLQFGLLERIGASYACTRLAVEICTAASDAGRMKALQEAALRPVVLRVVMTHMHGQINSAVIVRLALSLFGDRLTPAQAKIVAEIIPPTATMAGLLSATGEVALPQSSSITEHLAPQSVGDRRDSFEPLSAVSNGLHESLVVQHTKLIKDLGAGRRIELCVPTDLTQDERDNVMALIQYL